MATKRPLLLAIVLCALAGCGSDDNISRALQIVIPGEIPTIQNGTLYLSLWNYVGDVGTTPATLLDVEQTAFSHTAGQATAIILSVHGKPQSGRKHYLTVEGCVAGSNGATSVFNAFVLSGQQTMAIVVPSAAPSACAAAH